MTYQLPDIGYQEADMARTVQKTRVGKPQLERLGLVRGVLMGFRAVLDEEMAPLGITTAQLRVLWSVEINPDGSGAEVARYCALTPQSGQAILAGLEKSGWIKRRHSAANERVLVAEVTVSGRKVLERARRAAEALDRRIWKGIAEKDLAGMEAALKAAVEKLGQ
jgi:DNA-binding MarR family transcriptional regulator